MSGFVYSREAWELAKDKLSRSEPRWHDGNRLKQAITEVKDLVRSKNLSDQDVIDLLVESELELSGENPSSARVVQLGAVVRQALKEERESKVADAVQGKSGVRRKGPKKGNNKDEQDSEIGGNHQIGAPGRPDADTLKQPMEPPAQQPVSEKAELAEKGGGSSREAVEERPPASRGDEVPTNGEPAGNANELQINEDGERPNETGAPDSGRQATPNPAKGASGILALFEGVRGRTTDVKET
jgi:hypothetical protein